MWVNWSVPRTSSCTTQVLDRKISEKTERYISAAVTANRRAPHPKSVQRNQDSQRSNLHFGSFAQSRHYILSQEIKRIWVVRTPTRAHMTPRINTRGQLAFAPLTGGVALRGVVAVRRPAWPMAKINRRRWESDIDYGKISSQECHHKTNSSSCHTHPSSWKTVTWFRL